MAGQLDDLLVPMTNSPMVTICWSLLFLAENRHIQKRMQDEPDAVIGPAIAVQSDNSASGFNSTIRIILEKQSSLLYSMANIWEVFICSFHCLNLAFGRTSVIPILVGATLRLSECTVMTFARWVIKSMNVRGCDVPADSFLTISLWALNRDPTQWERPHEYWPEHFYGVDEEGAPCVKNLENLVPFSLGASTPIPRGPRDRLSHWSIVH